jgi:hypothetical protein
MRRKPFFALGLFHLDVSLPPLVVAGEIVLPVIVVSRHKHVNAAFQHNAFVYGSAEAVTMA